MMIATVDATVRHRRPHLMIAATSVVEANMIDHSTRSELHVIDMTTQCQRDQNRSMTANRYHTL